MSSSAILDNYNLPTLSYRGAVDITSAEYGSTLYNLFYDASLVSLGSVLMFEVKTIEENISIPTPSTVTLSFISIENATNTGISNQWQIAVPSRNYSYDPNFAVRIAVRVYIGITGTAEVGVTKWSNELEVHNPPAQPVIRNAFYNTPGDEDDLYIFLDLSENAYLTDGSLNFVAAFYYQNADNTTVWDVSAPLAAVDVSNNTYMIQVPDFGFVSTDASYSVVYTSLYAVYEFQDASSNNFYSVSHVSNTVSATPAADLPPVVTSVDYAVYDPSRNQTMTVFWNAPANENIPAFNVASYNVYVSTANVDASYAMVATGISSNVFSYTYDVSNNSTYPCGTTVYFKVQALLTDGSTSPLSTTNIGTSSMNIFYYAQAPTGLLVSDTSYNSGLVGMTVSFTGPTNIGIGCGIPLKFVVEIGNQSFDVSYNTIGGPGALYSVDYTNLAVPQTGTVEVYLVTQDTNPSEAGGSTYPERDGASTSTPYIAVNFVLEPVEYQVYDDESQDMDLSWNNPVPSLQLSGGWSVVNYDVQYQVRTPQGTLLNNNAWLDAPAGTNLGSTAYTFDATDVSCNYTVYFRIVANLVNITPEPDVYYSVISNVESINMFRYAQAPTGLEVSNTSYNSGLVGMTVSFTGPTDVGCGIPLNFVVVIGNQSFDVSYNTLGTLGADYSVVYPNLSVPQTGTVEVYLVTNDTNGNGAQDGASISTPYIATNLVLNSVNYQVYNNPASQNMDLSWNSQAIGGWDASYNVQFQINNTDTGGWLDASTNLGSTAYTFDASDVDCDSTVYFRIVANLVNTTPEPDVNYSVISNVESINKFRYAQAPTNLVITNTSYNAGQATLTVNFNTPSNNGCGDPLHFIVNIDGSLNQVNYDEDDTSYSQTFTLNVSQTGNVEVYLVTRDTNPSVPGGSTYPERNGASITTPYIATDLVLESVNYQVYDYPDSQNMVLTWNSQEDGNWDASYNVQYQVRTPQGTPLNNDDWLDASTNLVSTAYTFDASGVACNSTVYFRIVANLVNNTPNPDVNYQTISAPVSINMFRYATAPEYANVLWASADGSYNFMDIRMVFKNPASIGCGGAVKFVVNVLDASGNILKYYGTNNPATRDVSYNEVDPSPSYEVNFDGVTYASIGNVQVYLVTTDTNNVTIARNGARSNAGYLAARLPIYQDVSMNDDRNLLTFKVITQTPLVLVNGAITGELVGVLPVLTAYQWNSNGTTPGVTVNVTALANDELQYEIAMDPTVVDSPFPNPFSEPWGLLVANDVGIQEYNVDGLN